jgi:hypothetical protein
MVYAIAQKKCRYHEPYPFKNIPVGKCLYHVDYLWLLIAYLLNISSNPPPFIAPGIPAREMISTALALRLPLRQ